MTTTTDPTLELTLRLLKDLAGCADPRVALGQTAQKFNMPAARIRDLVQKYGWPNPGSMARAAVVLERKLQDPLTVVPEPEAAPRPGPAAAPPPSPEEPPAFTPRIEMLRLADLIPNPSNVPGRVDDIDDLAASIREVGLLQPLQVTEHPSRKGWLILFGHRRHAALLKLRHTHARCEIRTDAGHDIDQQMFLMLIENLHRKDLNAIEKAHVFGDLRDRRKLSLDQIAQRAGISRGTVSYYLSLLELDAQTQARVQTGEVQVTTAIQAVKTVRRQARRAAGGKPVGAPVQLEPAWFTLRHPHAADVRDVCSHTARPKVGRAGCGECWEQVIRADERAKAAG